MVIDVEAGHGQKIASLRPTMNHARCKRVRLHFPAQKKDQKKDGCLNQRQLQICVELNNSHVIP